jgi:hypothetical protein
MVRLVFLLVTLGLTPPPPQHDTHQPAADKPAALMRGLGRLHHPIATRSAAAQRFFDLARGLTQPFIRVTMHIDTRILRSL